MPHEPMTDTNTQKAQGSGAGNLLARVQYILDAETGPDFVFRKASLTRHDVREIAAALSQPPEASEVEAVAWLHTLHMEGGQTRSRLLEWDGVDEDKPERNGFGVPGRDYSACYSVTVTPLYAHPPKASPMQAMTLVQARRIVDAVTEHCRGADFSCDMKAATKSVLALAQPAPEQGEG